MINIDEEKAQDILKSFNIPAKPALIAEVQKECAQASPCIDTISKLVSEDVGLSAGILKAINSPIYGLSRTITDIKQSIIFLGIKSLVTLVNCFVLKQKFSGDAAISLERFWENSVEVAQISCLLVERLGLKNELPPEDVYTYALFQDCGIPPLAMKYSNYKTVLQEANRSIDVPFTQIESDHLNTNHAIVGYFVTNSWNLPKRLCQYVLMHHEPNYLELSFVDAQDKRIYSLLKMSSNILHKHKRLEDEAEWKKLKSDILDYMCMSGLDYDELEADLTEDFLETV